MRNFDFRTKIFWLRPLVLSETGSRFAVDNFMTKPKFHNNKKSPIQEILWKSVEEADCIHEMENKLIDILKEIDANRYFVLVGYKSLMGFCKYTLRFSRTQSQRIVKRVRSMSNENMTMEIDVIDENDHESPVPNISDLAIELHAVHKKQKDATENSVFRW